MSLLIPKGDTLVTYYILPLVGVNKLTFGRSFKTSYVDLMAEKVYVELTKNMYKATYKSNANYLTEMVHNNIKFVVFLIPEEFLVDAQLFTMGSYSKMGAATKKKIYFTSSLPYNSTMGSFTNTHPILQALDRTKKLRAFLQEELGMDTIPDSNELIDKPHPEWYIENRFKTK